jgi:WD40 repeat protein
MTTDRTGSSERERRWQAVLVACLEALEAGQAVNRHELLARHPEFAAELAEFFANRDRLDQVAAPLRPAAPLALRPLMEAPTLGPEESAAAGLVPGVKVRYFGDYELLEEIAHGGMGVVYKARQVSLNRIVALKMILAGQLASPADVQRFHTEAEAAANLDHPHIVPIHEVGVQKGQHYFSMKLVEGGNLADQLSRFTGDRRAAAALLAEVARAVHYAHQRGILHRDLKPANILLDAQGQPHVTDFGLAKRVTGDSALTQSGAIVGTPSYMAPEQARAQKGLTTAADLFSLGAILYELLTGRPPFKAATPLDTILQVLEQEPERPRSLNPQVDRDLETICLKCLEKEPQRRYGSAEALAEDLEQWLNGEPIQARPITALERAVKWAKRRPAVAALLASIFVVIILGFGGVVWQWQQAETARAEAADRADAEQRAKEEAEQARQQEADARRQEEEQRKRAEAALAEADRNLYFNRIAVADGAWLAGHVDQADQLLDACPPGRRGWEWHYLKRLCHKELHILRHGGQVESLVVSPDGKCLASLSVPDGKVIVWDVTTGAVLRELRHSAASCLAFSPDGQHLACAGGAWEEQKQTYSGWVKILEWTTDRPLRTLTSAWTTRRDVFSLRGDPHLLECLAFSPDGRLLAACGDRMAKVWDTTTGQETLTVRDRGLVIRRLAFSPDGRRLATAADGSVKIWEVPSGHLLLNLSVPVTHFRSLAFSPDGRRLAGACRDRTLRVWDAHEGSEVGICRGHAGGVFSVAFSPDGRQLVSGADQAILKLWDSASGSELASLRGHNSEVWRVAFSPDGRRIFSAGSDGTVRIWDATATEEPLVLRGAERVAAVAFQADGQQLVAVSARRMTTWDVTTGRVRGTAPGSPAFLALALYWPLLSAPLQPWFSTAFGTRFIDRSEWISLSSYRAGAVVSPDGRRLASESRDGIRIWDTGTGQVSRVLGRPTREIPVLAFHSDGNRLAVASQELDDKGGEPQHTIRIWDVTTGRLEQPLASQTSQPLCLAFAPKGKHLAAGRRDGTVQVWDAETGQESCTLRVGPPGVSRIAFSPDGNRLASGDTGGGIRLWDLKTAQEVLAFRTLGNTVIGLAFHPDGHRLASSHRDGTVTLYQSAATEPVLSLRGSPGYSVDNLTFSPDGTRLAAAGEDGTVRVWDATPWAGKPDPAPAGHPR